ncbi:MAG TPA: hypothetical protein VEI07_08325 [Planctomycetaceae bacterium]|nr:hypothetical protein [Planctomycetaceae bacterium]
MRTLAALFAGPLWAMAMRLALGRLLALCGIFGLCEILGRRVQFRCARATKGSFEIQIGAEIVVSRGRGRSALRTRRSSWPAIATPRPLAFGPLGLFSLASRLRRFGGHRLGGLWLSGGWCRFVEHQVFGRDLGVGRRLGAEINSEQVFGQRFPGIFFAARAGAQRIGVHKA